MDAAGKHFHEWVTKVQIQVHSRGGDFLEKGVLILVRRGLHPPLFCLAVTQGERTSATGTSVHRLFPAEDGKTFMPGR